jgi:fucose permease
MKKNGAVLAAGFTGMAFFGIAFVVMGAVMPSLIAKFSLHTSTAATLAGLLPAGVLVGSLVFGPVIDRYGYKSLIIVSSLVTACGLELLAFAESIPVIRLSVFIIGTGGGILNGLTNALVSEASSDKSRASNLSILGIFYTVGAIAIPLLFASLSKWLSYTPIVSGAGILVGLSTLFHIMVTFPKAKFRQGFPIKKVALMAKESVILILSLVLFFQSGLEGISNNWISSFLEIENGISKESALYSLSFVVIGIGTGRIILSILLKFIPKITILIVSMIIAATGIIIISSATNGTISAIGTFLMGLGLAATFPVVLGEIGERYKEISGTAFSFALVIALTGNTLINLLVGALQLYSFPYIAGGSIIFIIILYTTNYLGIKKSFK